MTSKLERMADMIDEDLRDGTCPRAGQTEQRAQKSMLNDLLSDSECAYFLDMPGSYRDMLRACFKAGAARERQACWDEVNKLIVPGELQGNGCDDAAQRNGLILASNLIMGRITAGQHGGGK